MPLNTKLASTETNGYRRKMRQSSNRRSKTPTSLPVAPVAAAIPPPSKVVGRKRDASRDAAILDAAVGILSEVGYDDMTMEMVAARAKAGKGTVYRRWSSKAEMVLDAVTRMKRSQVDLDGLPDTGSLRGDLLALFRPPSMEEAERKMRTMAGLASMLSQNPALAEAGHAAIVAPWVEANRTLIRRAVGRGEASNQANIETIAQVIPSMAAYRAMVQRRPFERDFLVEMIDGLLLPALGITRPG